jgi:hypothetical protein
VNAAEVLDHKADLMVRLENPTLRNAWKHQVFLDFRDTDIAAKEGLDERSARNNALVTIEQLRTVLPEAEAFYVSPDMTSLVSFAATQLDDTDRVNRLMMPTRSGIARFDGGLPFQDVRGKQMRISWIVWGPILTESRRHDSGEPSEWTMLWMFNDHRDEPDEVALELAEQEAHLEELRGRVQGRWGFTGAQSISDGQRLGPAWQPPPEAKVETVLAEGGVPVEYSNLTRLIHAFWLLCNQTVAEKVDADIDRPRRKRAGRANIPPRVVVIRLRNRSTHRAEGESLVDWHHRWVVRGHPAWRACGADHPLAEPYPDDPTRFRCRVWIAPYTKGPEGKPLVVSDKVYSLQR